MKKSIIYFIVFLGLQATASIIVTGCWRLITGNSDITTTNLIVTSVLSSGLTIALFLLARWAVVSPNWLRSRQWTVLIWSVIAAMGTIIPSMWIQEHMPDLPNLLENEFDQLLSSRMGYFTLALLAPLAEEIVFRGAVLKALLGSYRPWTAIVVSAVFFALAHLNPAQMPHAFAIGLLLGWMYYRTGSILPGMAYHWFNNSVAYVLYNVYPDPDIRLADIFKGSEQHVLMAVGFSLLILVPALYQLYLRMKTAEQQSFF